MLCCCCHSANLYFLCLAVREVEGSGCCREGNKEFKAELQGRTGLNIATGAEACRFALEKFKAKKICIFTPYADIGDKNVVKFFEEIGCEVSWPSLRQYSEP